MPQSHDTAQHAFWTFSVSLYRSEVVSTACIALQDRCGLDVNMLLFALYAGSRGRSLSHSDLRCLERAVAPWRANVVLPLRAVRRWLKQASFASGAVESLRAGVLGREIDAEAQQQHLMEQSVPTEPGIPDADTAAHNLLRYLELSGVVADEQTTGELSALLAETFPDIDRATARTRLLELGGRTVNWKLRARVFVQRLIQPTCSCMICMSAPTFANLVSFTHWKIALQTGLGTGMLALLLAFTPVARLFAHRYGNALLMGILTAIADAWSHPGRFSIQYGEALLTGVVSALIALAASFVVENRARRVRRIWAWLRHRRARRATPA